MTTYGAGKDSLFGCTEAHQGTDARHLARADDPTTSKQAAAKVAAKLNGEEEYAYACVLGNPGWTGNELDNHYQTRPEGRIRKRLAGLERKGRIHRGLARQCRITGGTCVTWWPNERDAK